MLTTGSTTQLRPSLEEAAKEAFISSDSHWTATLSRIGMTRVSRSTVLAAYWNDYYYG